MGFDDKLVSINNLSFYYDQSLLEEHDHNSDEVSGKERSSGGKNNRDPEKENLLQNISINVKPGEAVLLTGGSGCGKTSIIRFINGLIPHFFGGYREGTVELFSASTDSLKVWEYGKKVGSVFQNPKSQFFANKVSDELAFACENYGINSNEIIKRREEVIKTCNLEYLRDKDVHQLSSGEKQKLAFASSMMLSPKLYVMDEPSANLDMASAYMLRDIINEVKQSGSSFLITEHRLYYLLDIIDRIYYIKEGRIEQEFSVSQFLQLKNKEADNMGLRRRFTGFQDVIDNIPAKKTENSKLLMEINNIHYKFREMKTDLLNGINLKINSGEVIALTGPNGAGKTTLAKIICGLKKEQKGQIIIKGKKVPLTRRPKHVWFVMQETGCQLFAESVFDEMLIGIKKTDANRARAHHLLKELKLDSKADQHPAALSGREAQRLTFAVAMMQNTEIVIFDEPTSGLDGANLKRVESFIEKLRSNRTAVIIITHDHELIAQSCSRIVYMDSGIIQTDTALNEESYSSILDKWKS